MDINVNETLAGGGMLNGYELQDLAFLITFSVLYLAGLPLFIIRRQKEPIRSRGWLLVILQLSVLMVDLPIRTAASQIGCFMTLAEDLFLIPLWTYPYFVRCAVLWMHFTAQTSLSHFIKNPDANSRSNRVILSILGKFEWMLTNMGQLVTFLVLFTTTLIVLLTFYFGTDLNTIVCYSNAVFTFQIFQGILFVIFLLLFVILLWRVQDAYLIKVEMILAFCCGLPVFLLWIVGTVLNWNNFWLALTLNLGQLFSLFSMWMPIYATYRYEKYSQLQDDNLEDKAGIQRPNVVVELEGRSSARSSRSLDNELDFVINHQVLGELFEQFAIQTWAVENLLFVKAVNQYKQLEEGDRQQSAIKIIDDFILQRSRAEINIDKTLREELIEMDQRKEYSKDMFAKVEKEMCSLLREGPLVLFRNSGLCTQALKELGAASVHELQLREFAQKN